MGWNTPRVDDYARVLRDETNDNATVEWYIDNIEDGVITWANPVILNTSDYQAQTTAADSGRVLTGGSAAGTFGDSLAVDVEPTENSNNLINSNAVFALMKTVFLLSHPVGSIYMTVSQDENTKEKMQNKYGGIWEAWGRGRVPVGIDSGTFNTVEKTGGAETHALTAAQMPRHTHVQNSHDHTQNPHNHIVQLQGIGVVAGGIIPWGGGAGAGYTDGVAPVINAVAAVNQYTGGSGAAQSASADDVHNNLQPYITCYMYKRMPD